jgi:hypothetical protein
MTVVIRFGDAEAGAGAAAIAAGEAAAKLPITPALIDLLKPRREMSVDTLASWNVNLRTVHQRWPGASWVTK